MHGLTRALVNNMVRVSPTAIQKPWNLVGVGYRAAVQGKKLVMNLGYSHPVEILAHGRHHLRRFLLPPRLPSEVSIRKK